MWNGKQFAKIYVYPTLVKLHNLHKVNTWRKILFRWMCKTDFIEFAENWFPTVNWFPTEKYYINVKQRLETFKSEQGISIFIQYCNLTIIAHLLKMFCGFANSLWRQCRRCFPLVSFDWNRGSQDNCPPEQNDYKILIVYQKQDNAVVDVN